ncbi:MAG: pantoate--beta-alanine ligase [Candidatus Marinimicrobia bacterium]|nr:pantoate--beta-alanine ligase [Candidatus Neomarinimicrobiota bacterium]
MRIIKSVAEMQAYSDSLRSKNIKIGFVPTMGALHDGHLSLVKKSTETTDQTILSIFVNPVQFTPSEDFNEYPRDFRTDEESARVNGVDVIFYPSVEEIYPDGYSTFSVVEGLSDILEGASRPSHFKGVTTIVNKLFNIVNPQIAFFGQKDAQQAVIIKKMVTDLNLNVEIIVCPTIRESDGLALSSRNTFLTREEREQAPVIYKALTRAESLHTDGKHESSGIISLIEEIISSATLAKIDYVAVVDEDTLQPVESTLSGALVAIAVSFSATRLIDNTILPPID